ncbi:hypothetical protein BBH99_16485 [Chryseobacterium contaminans]|uniref:YD repeat-containing protein n=1 Tax=Chryseobacterium contaminans TaxID=1423959 RepID=A0ABX2X9S9_9FLAO|nr:hypothetical protein BBH99_16485 [Chryseobacterium contaminans]
MGFSQIFKDPKNIYPYAPETSSLLKYRETPVSNYTGVPDISIPIYTVKSGSVEVPITLNYHSGGILVSEIATSVGLGWSINTISPITRKINGYTDENGVMRHDDNIESFLNSGIDNQELRLKMTAFGLSSQSSIADLMSDEFSLSIDNFSGSFFYNPKDKKIVTFPISDMKIGYFIKNLSLEHNRIDTINVITTNGLKYIFGGDGIETSNATGSMMTSNYYGVNAWKIKKIKGIDNNEINFSYLSNHYFRRELAPQTITIPYTNYAFSTGACGGVVTEPSTPEVPSFDITYEMQEALPEKIETSDAVVSFVYSDRLDFSNLKKLDKILVKDKSGRFISEKRFNYGYFETIPDPSSANDPTEDITKRLKLLSYQECDQHGKCITTSFQYYEENKMAQRLSYATDHWGYFNGKFNNYGYPNVPIKYYKFSGNSIITVDGWIEELGSTIARIANKNVEPEFTKTFSLKSVTYPEGGKNEFIYEPNTASSMLYEPSEEHYYLAKKKTLPRGDSFVISGSVQGENINYSHTPTINYGTEKIFVKEIDLSSYRKDLDLELTMSYSSTFRASSFSNSLNDSYLRAEIAIYYYENGVKKYWLQSSPLKDEVTMKFRKFNNLNVPAQKIYAEIKHIYWGGLSSYGNISDYIYFYSQIAFSWDIPDPNAGHDSIILGGGIRIKEIKNYDNDGQYKYSTKYSYTKNGNGLLSSGVLFNIPMYTKNNRIGVIKTGQCPDGTGPAVSKTINDAIEVSVRPAINGMRTQGKTIGYTNVEVVKTNAANTVKGKEIFQYYVESPLETGDNFLATTESTSARYEFMESRDWRNGQLLKYIALNNTNDTLKVVKRDFYLAGPPKVTTDYQLERNIKMILYHLISPIDYLSGGKPLRDTSSGASMMEPDVSINGIFPSYIGVNTNSSPGPFPILVRHNDAFLLKKETITEYFNDGKKKSKIIDYFYDEPLFPTQITLKSESYSEGIQISSKMDFAYQKGNQLMISKNMIDIPLETIITQKTENTTKTLFKISTTYPVTQTEANTKTSGLILPTSVQSYDLQNLSIAHTEVTYDKYDSKGNLQQYTTKDGISTVIIWGYNGTQPIAKIVGAKLSDISQSLIDSIVNASNTDAAAERNNDETNLLNAFNTFKSNLGGYQITTYTYDPLIGVRSITPPSGIRESYLYDSANRLEKVVDANGKIVKEMKYNYKN